MPSLITSIAEHELVLSISFLLLILTLSTHLILLQRALLARLALNTRPRIRLDNTDQLWTRHVQTAKVPAPPAQMARHHILRPAQLVGRLGACAKGAVGVGENETLVVVRSGFAFGLDGVSARAFDFDLEGGGSDGGCGGGVG